MRTEAISKALSRVGALARLAENEGAAPGEAQNAARAGLQLMRKNNLRVYSADEVRELRAELEAARERIIDLESQLLERRCRPVEPWRLITSRFHSFCGDCGYPVQEGTSIWWRKGERGRCVGCPPAQ